MGEKSEVLDGFHFGFLFVSNFHVRRSKDTPLGENLKEIKKINIFVKIGNPRRRGMQNYCKSNNLKSTRKSQMEYSKSQGFPIALSLSSEIFITYHVRGQAFAYDSRS